MPQLDLTSDKLALIGKRLALTHGDYTIRSGGIIEFLDANGKPKTEQPSESTLLQALLDGMKEDAQERIDNIAELERRKYLSPGSTLPTVLMYKAMQAQQLKDLIEDDKDYRVSDFPLLAVEIGRAGQTDIKDVMDNVLNKRDFFINVIANIEGKRLNTKDAVKKATSVQQIENIVANFRFDV